MKNMLFFKSKFVSKILFGAFIFCALLMSACEEAETPVPVNETGTVTDVDGNVYKTVKIGNQWWMAENLRVKNFRDGSQISMLADNASWGSGTAAYCTFEGLPATPGLLYNWEAIIAAPGLAPEGWRIPSDEDWKQLEKALGMSDEQAEKTGWRGTNEGEKLKLPSTDGWEEFDNVWSTNESGFSAEAGSCRLFDGTFGFPGLTFQGFWWTTSESDSENAWYRHLYYKERGVFRFTGSKKYGYSVRCVKN